MAGQSSNPSNWEVNSNIVSCFIQLILVSCMSNTFSDVHLKNWCVCYPTIQTVIYLRTFVDYRMTNTLKLYKERNLEIFPWPVTSFLSGFRCSSK